MFGPSGVYGIPDSGCMAGSHPSELLPHLAVGLSAVMGWVVWSGQPNLSKCLPGQDALQRKLLTSLCCAVGTFAVISIIVGNVCNELAPESDFQYFNHTTNETSVNTTALEAARLEISATLACLTAIIQVRTRCTACAVSSGQSWPTQSQPNSLSGAETVVADARRGPTSKWMMPQHRVFWGSHPSCSRGVKFSERTSQGWSPGAGSQPVMTPQHPAAFLSPPLLRTGLLSPARAVAVWEGCILLPSRAACPTQARSGSAPRPFGLARF